MKKKKDFQEDIKEDIMEFCLSVQILTEAY